MTMLTDLGIHVDEGRGGNQKTQCPKCSPNRKNKTDRCLSVNLDEGVYNCHHCDFKGPIKNYSYGNRKSKIVETYDYKDQSGNLIYQSVRFIPKSFRQRRPDGKGEWIWNLKGANQVPYRLPELIASTDMIFIAGGEKDVESLVKLGLTATTNSGGEGNWKQEFSEYLKGRDVVILEDNDSKGQKHGKTISEGQMGIAKTIKIVRFPELPKGGDVSDYLTTHNIEEFIKLVEETPIFQGSYKEHFCDVTGNALNILAHTESWNQIRELDIKVEWIVDHLIPKGAIIILFGKGGIGKTWLVMDIARCIGSGIDYLGYATQETLVIFVDFENPLTVLNTRTQRMGEAEGVHFWRVANDLKPPKLDSDEWEEYKELPDGTVLIFDTLRASHSKDENSSEHMAMVMERVKELRDCGFTVILLHHTPKNSEKISKGSTAIVDLADHILNLSRVRISNGGEDKLVHDDDDDEEAVYRFGVREKTRFEPHQIYLTLNPDRGFDLAPDPEEETLERICQLLLDTGPLPKTAFAKECKTLGLGQKKALKLIERGTGRFWRVESMGQKNAQVVTAIQIGSSATPIGNEKLPNCPDDKLEPDKQESFVI
jgi:archaellum biogenesis ATPase FlaH/predicted RNA-binding Zn-ribbon protein involved in translation (DUF1610 family)